MWLDESDTQTRHHISALVFVELTEDPATTENMVLVTHQTTAAPYINGSGIYRNKWRKPGQGRGGRFLNECYLSTGLSINSDRFWPFSTVDWPVLASAFAALFGA